MGSDKVRIRRPRATDARELGDVIFSAFAAVAKEFSYRSTFPEIDAGVREAERLLASRRYFGYVAVELDRLVGAAFGMDGNEVSGIGPIVVRPDRQGRGIGRRLMRALMADVERRGYAHARLQQDAPNVRSMTLYATVGFAYVDTTVILEAPPSKGHGITVAGWADVAGLAALCRQIYGIDRSLEIHDAIGGGQLLAAVRSGTLDGYLVPTVFGHGVAVDPTTAIRLVRHAAWLANRPMRFIVLLRQADLYRKAIAADCRPVKVMNLMSWGPYVSPGEYALPSISF